jgi:hypothetical protein
MTLRTVVTVALRVRAVAGWRRAVRRDARVLRSSKSRPLFFDFEIAVLGEVCALPLPASLIDKPLWDRFTSFAAVRPAARVPAHC